MPGIPLQNMNMNDKGEVLGPFLNASQLSDFKEFFIRNNNKKWGRFC